MLVLDPSYFDQLYFALVFIALTSSGLIAGVFFTFSTFVMKALVRLLPAEGIKAMQSINITVLNSWFLGVFLGNAVISIILLVWSFLLWDQMESGYVIMGSALYLVGSLLVTIVFNVPKNEALAIVDALAADSERFWNNYVDEWTFWNHVRTIASLLAAVCFVIGL